MQKTPGIYVEIRGNSSQLREELKKVKAETDQLSQDVSKALNNMFTAADVRKAVDSLANDLSRVQALAKNAGKDVFKGQSEAVDKFAKSINLAGKEYLDLQNKMLSNKAATSQEAALNRVAKAAGLTTREIQELGKQLGMANKSAEAMLQSGIKAGLDSVAMSLDRLKAASSGAGLSAVSTDLANAAKAANLTEQEFKELQDQIIKTANTKALESSLKSIASAAGMSASQIDAFGTKMGASVKNIENVKTALGMMASKTNEASGALGVVGVAIGTAFGAVAGQAIGSVGQKIIEFVKVVISAGLAMDSLNMSYSAIFGGETGAAREMLYVSETADRLGQSFMKLADSYRLYSAAAAGTSMSQQELKEGFEAITAASTVLGLSTERTELVFKSFTQIMSKGQVMMEEVKNQLGDSLPGALDLFARSVGKSKSEFMELAKEGKLLSDDVLPKVFAEMKKTYELAAETAALETGRAAVNRLASEWDKFKISLFDTKAFVAATNGVNLLVKAARYAIEGLNVEEKLIQAQRELASYESGLGEGLPFYEEGLEKARKKVVELKDALRQLKDPAKDSFQVLEDGAAKAETRAAAYIKEVNAANEAVRKSNQTERDKLDEEYNRLKIWTTDRVGLEKWYNSEVAKLQAAEDKRKESSLKKGAAAENKAANDRKRAIEAYYNYIGNQESASSANRVANIEADRDKLLSQMAANLSSYKDYEAMRQQIIAESARRIAAVAAEEAAKREAAIDSYYDYVGSKAAGSEQNQISRERRKVDAVIEGLRQELGETEEFLKLKDALLKVYDKKATDIVEKGEKERSKIREEMEDEIFDAYATDLQKQKRAVDKYLKEQKKAYLEANDSLVADGKKTTQELSAEFDVLAAQYREAMEYANDPTIQAFRAAWDSAVERLDDAFLDLWDSFLEGGESTFDAFKRLFNNLLAELAHAAITKPIVLQLGTSMSNMLYGQGSATEGATGGGNMDFSSIFGAAGGNSSIADSINTYAANTFPSVFGGATIASAGTPLSSVVSSSSASLAAAEAGTTLSTPLTSSGTSFLGAAGGALGVAGGIYQAAQGGTQNTVSGVGTAIGGALAFTPFAWASPIVMVASQILGSMLADEVHSPSVIFQQQTTDWGQADNFQYHTKSGGSDETAAQLVSALGGYMDTVFTSVEQSLATVGDEYVSMLDDAAITWGRKAGGSWKEWDFGSDMDMSELMAKAQADLKAEIYEAASGAFTAAGKDLATGEGFSEALALLGGDAATSLQGMSDVLAAGVQSGDIETYAAQIQAFQATIQNVTAAWETVLAASAEVVDPLNSYESAQKKVNDQYDSWIATIEALGFASEQTSILEADRAKALEAVDAEYAESIAAIMQSADQTARPISSLAEAQQRANEQFDGWITQLEDLGATQEQIAAVEADRVDTLQDIRDAADEADKAQRASVLAQLEANRSAVAASLQSASELANPLTEAEKAALALDGQFDTLIASMEKAGASSSQLAQAEGYRAEALQELAAAEGEARQSTIDAAMQSASELANPMTEAASATLALTTQFDELVASMVEAGASSTELAAIETNRADALADLAAANQKSIDALLNEANEITNPLTEAESATLALTTQFDELVDSLGELGASSEELAAIETNRADALADLAAANRTSIDALIADANELANPLTDSEEAIRDVNERFDSFVESLLSLGASEADLAQVEAARIETLDDLAEATLKSLQADEAARQAVISEAMQSAYEIANPLTGFEAAIQGVNEQFDDLVETMIEAGASAGQLASVEVSRQDALDNILADQRETISGILADAQTAANPLTNYESDFESLDDQYRKWRDQLEDSGASLDDIIALYDRWDAAIRALKDQYRDTIDAVLAEADQIGGVELTEAQTMVEELDSQFDALLEQLVDAGATEDDIARLEAARQAGLAAAAQTQMENIQAVIDEAARMATPLDSTAEAIRQVNEQFDAYLESVRELGATQEQVKAIEDARGQTLYNLARAQADALAEELAAVGSSIAEYLDPMTAFEAEIAKVNEQFDGWIAGLETLGATQDQLAEIEAKRADVLEGLSAQYADALAEELSSVNALLDNYISPLTQYESEIASANQQIDSWIAGLIELGATQEQIAAIEARRADVLDQLAANQAMVEAEEAVELAKTNLESAYTAEVAALEKIISDHEAAVQAAESALQNAYTAEVSRLESVIADRDSRVEDARSDLTAAYREESSALQETSTRFKGLAQQLDDWISDFWSGGQSPLDMQGRISLLYADFRTALEGALSGDESSFEDLLGTASDYLDAAKANASTREEYARIAGSVSSQIAAASGVAESQASVADQQLAALEAQVSGIAGIVEAQATFTEAFEAYQAAMADTSAADAQAQLSQLKAQMDALDLLDKQVDFAEALADYQEELLDQSAEDAQRMINLMTLEYNAIMGIKDAVLSFAEEAEAARAAQAKAAALSISSISGYSTPSTPKYTSGSDSEVYNPSTGSTVLYNTLANAVRVVADNGTVALDVSPDWSAQQIASQAKANYETFQRLGNTSATEALWDYAKNTGIKLFASGGFHDGGLRIVGENGPELEYTGPSRIWNAEDTRAILGGGGSQSELVAEIQQLRAEIRAANGAIARNTMDTAKLMRRWDGDGMPDTRAA